MMYGGLFQSTTIPILQEAVNFAQTRHTVLAGNLANMDTPGYKVRDLSVEDFQQRLKSAIEQKRQAADSRASNFGASNFGVSNFGVANSGMAEHWSPGDLSGRRSSTPMAEVSKNPKTITRHDKGNIGMEYQVTEIAKNQMQHNLALTLLVNQFRLLQAAISERA